MFSLFVIYDLYIFPAYPVPTGQRFSGDCLFYQYLVPDGTVRQ